MKIKITVTMVLMFFLGIQNLAFTTTGQVEIDINKEAYLNIGYDLPIVIVDTGGQEVADTLYIESQLSIINNAEGLNYIFDAPEITSTMGIKIRGKSSRRFPKKQYRLELWNEKGEDKRRSLLGLPEDSDWILYGPFKDKSFMRNALAYDIAGEIMTYAPRTAYCEVFLKDDGYETLQAHHYNGLYLLVEDIKVGVNRVNIYQSYAEVAETSFLVSKDVPKLDDYSFTSYGKETIVYPREIEVNYPNKVVSEDQLTYMSRTVSEFERALYSSNYNRDDGGYGEYIDIPSFIDYYIINEFFRNTDAGVYSTYFYKDYGEKIFIGPVWDFNEAMGNDSDMGNYFEYTGFHMYNDFWYKRLMTDREFISDLIKRYRLLRRTFLSDEHLLEWVEKTSETIENASQRNYEKWPFELCMQAETFENTWLGSLGYEDSLLYDRLDDPEQLALVKDNQHLLKDPPALLQLIKDYGLDQTVPGMALNYQEEKKGLKKFLLNRGKWMDDNIEHLLKFTY